MSVSANRSGESRRKVPLIRSNQKEKLFSASDDGPLYADRFIGFGRKLTTPDQTAEEGSTLARSSATRGSVTSRIAARFTRAAGPR